LITPAHASVSRFIRRKASPDELRQNLAQHIVLPPLAILKPTTRPRVNTFMNKFRKLGFIDYNGHLQIHSSLLSVVLHDDA
jgi:CRP/FNR family cyclic AMP-dependent transcriptional regulator